MDFNGYQTVQGTKDSFSAASKGFKRFQTTNKGLINRNDRSLKKKKSLSFISSNACLALFCDARL